MDPTAAGRKHASQSGGPLDDFSELRTGKYRTDVSDVCPSSTARVRAMTPLSSASWEHVWKQM